MGKHHILYPNIEMVPAVSIAAARGHVKAGRFRAFPDCPHTKRRNPAGTLHLEALNQTKKDRIGLLQPFLN